MKFAICLLSMFFLLSCNDSPPITYRNSSDSVNVSHFALLEPDFRAKLLGVNRVQESISLGTCVFVSLGQAKFLFEGKTSYTVPELIKFYFEDNKIRIGEDENIIIKLHVIKSDSILFEELTFTATGYTKSEIDLEPGDIVILSNVFDYVR